MIFSMV